VYNDKITRVIAEIKLKLRQGRPAMSIEEKIKERNKTRANDAATCLGPPVCKQNCFGCKQGQVTDLLGNLMHLCDDRGLDFEILLDRAQQNYAYELEHDD